MGNYLISYSSKGFYKKHKDLNLSAKKYGIAKIFSYHDYNLKRTSFYKKNINILSRKKGGGFWLWKPYYILHALNKIKTGDNLIYVDAASEFIDSAQTLFDLLDKNENGIIAFDKRPLTNGQYCKRGTFVNLKCDTKEYWEAPQVIATMILIKKNSLTVSFINEWLKECQNPINILDPVLNNDEKTNELPFFVDHRQDQSILSLLVKKYNFETFRSPTKWGNYLKLPQFRIEGEYVGYPYNLNNTIKAYDSNPMSNSPYGVIFEINRGKDEPTFANHIKANIYNYLIRIKNFIKKRGYEAFNYNNKLQ